MDVTQNSGVDGRSGYAPEDSASSGYSAEASELTSNNFSILTTEDVMQASGVFLNSGEEHSMCREDIFFPGRFTPQSDTLDLPFYTENSELVNLGSQHLLPHTWHPHAPASSDLLAPGIQDDTYPQKRKSRKDTQTKLQIQPVDRECNLQCGPMNPGSQEILVSTYSSGPLLQDWQQYASPLSNPQAPSTQDGTVPPKRRGRKDPKPKALKTWQWPPQTDQNLEAMRLRAVKARNQRVAKSTELDQMQRDLDDVHRESNNIRMELSECETRVRKLEIVKNEFII